MKMASENENENEGMISITVSSSEKDINDAIYKDNTNSYINDNKRYDNNININNNAIFNRINNNNMYINNSINISRNNKISQINYNNCNPINRSNALPIIKKVVPKNNIQKKKTNKERLLDLICNKNKKTEPNLEKTISHKKNDEVKNNDRSRNHKNDKIENDKSGTCWTARCT